MSLILHTVTNLDGTVECFIERAGRIHENPPDPAACSAENGFGQARWTRANWDCCYNDTLKELSDLKAFWMKAE